MNAATAQGAFVALRTPLLPVEVLLDWTSGLGARAAWERGEPLAPAIAADRTLLRERLVALVARPEVREAIFVASPSLDETIGYWLREPESDRGQRAERALVRYLGRMTTRPTPFGLFAGVSIGAIEKETRLGVASSTACRRHTRLDNDYLFALVQALTRDSALERSLRYLPNDSLCAGGGRFRYVEARVEGTPPRRSHHLVSAADTPELRATLSRATGGATRTELAEGLVDDETGLSEAQGFIDELIEAQVLVPVLALPITGPEPLPVLIRELGEHASLHSTVLSLRGVEAAMAAIDQAPLGVMPDRYRELARTLEPLPAKVELATLFQVDLVRPASGLALGEPVLREVHRGVELLHRLGGDRRRDLMSRFRDAFRDRYEGHEVPLLEALDEEVGLGGVLTASNDPSPLLRGMTFAEPPDQGRPWGTREQHLLTLLGHAVQDGRDEILLQDSDLDRLAIPGADPLPDSFEVMATLLASSALAIERGNFRLALSNASGPPGARFLGRFCHADPALANRVDDLLRAEERHDPDAIYAEVVHLPEGRLGNILLRPQLRSHEITYLGRSGAPEDRQIPATDLLLSLEDGRFVLRSARLNRRVVPRLTTAHNFSTGLGVYRFLCLLQSQGVAAALAWEWGPLAHAPFLPRVRAGRIILAPMQWNLSQQECRRLGEARGDARFERVQELRRQRRVPRWVALADYDNRLPVDLDNPLGVEVLVHEIKGRDSALLVELSLGLDNLCVESPEGHHTHEIVVPFVASPHREVTGRPPSRESSVAPQPTDRPTVPRQFPPGSEWLFTKLYTSPAMEDEILTEVIGPVTRDLLERGAATGWFFLRYADPEQHLRWRLTGDPARLREEAGPAVQSAAARLLAEGKIWRIQFDTYQREVERYGGAAGMELSEQVFRIDSETVLDLIDMLEPGDAGLDERWRLALHGAHRLMDDAGLDLRSRRDQTRQWCAQWLKPFSSSADLRHQIAERYRKERSRLEPLLLDAYDPDGDLAPGIAIYQERSERLAPLMAELRRLWQSGELSVSLTGLVQSYVHMHLNRLLRSAANHHEVVLYDFLSRLYDARLSRAPAAGPAG